MVNAWLLLALTIFLEVAGTIAMKKSQGLTILLPSIFIYVTYGACFSIFAVVIKTIELSVAYAIWAGVGTAIVSLVGILLFQESISLWKLTSIGLIIIGVVGLKLS